MPSTVKSKDAMAEDDPAYDSSDVDFDEPGAEFKHVGHKSIKAMLEAPFSRTESKKWIRQLTQSGKWHERYACWLWWNRLTAFREQLLLKP
jgi:hypothetical protein